MDQDEILEKQNEKQLEKESTAKAGAVATHAVADYYTGGAYEKIRNMPVVGGVAKAAEQQVGKRFANMPGSKRLGKAAKMLDDAGALDMADQATSMLGGKSPNKEDVDAINKRGKNQADFGKSFSRKSKEENTTSTSGKDSLSKDGLNKDKEQLEKKKNNKTTNANQANKSNPLSALKNDKNNQSLNGLKAKIMKLKVTLIIIGIALAIFGFVYLVAFFSYTWDAFTNAISTFFGISETDTKENMSIEEADGLFTNEKYLYDENGESYTMETLVQALKEDTLCSKVTNWNSFTDIFKDIDEPCIFLRIVNRTVENLEKQHDIKLDKSIVISSIFYGYAAQPGYDNYDNPDNAESIIPAVNHYESLTDVLKDGKLTKDNIVKIIENSLANTTFTYYTWKVEKVGNKTVGKCVANSVKDVRYSLDKWKLFMRYGEEVANTWEKDIVSSKQWQTSDEECNGTISTDDLLNVVDSLDPLVYTIRNNMSKGESVNQSLFEQAADIESGELDIFKSYTNTKGKTIEFDYRNGFVYKIFPAFEQAINDPTIDIEYDEVMTPKEIESIIQNIISKKYTLNEILLFEDQDKPNNYYGSYNGYSSVVLGAYCGDLLTAPLDQINVNITDCDGNPLTTTTFKEYIMGVAYLEVSDTEDDYVKSEMLAAKNYALYRSGNYQKGTTINMKSGNCDQVYCPMSLGCDSKTSKLDCGGFKCTSYIPGGTDRKPASQALIDKYSSYYDELADMLVIDKKTGKIANTPYVSSRQKEWEKSAKQGMNFTQIIIESYAKDGYNYEIIRCSEKDASKNESENSNIVKYGNKISEEYPNQAPDKGKYYGYSYSDAPDGQEITINPEWIEKNIETVNSDCKEANWNINYEVNRQAADNYKKAFSNICKILKEGVKISTGEKCKYTVDDLQGGETFAQRKTINDQISDISYGITQDWNYNKKITIGNKTYQPYSSNRDAVEYQSFVNALGGEENCENINYILYEYAYKEAGFEWGGNWGRKGNNGTYNGMHFYVKE